MNSILTTILVILMLCTIASMFMLYRNSYVFKIRVNAIHAIYNYQKNLIELGLFKSINSGSDYDKMLFKYNEQLYNLKLWGKYSSIRKEYQELMIPYFDITEE